MEYLIFILLHRWKYGIAELKALFIPSLKNPNIKSVTYVAREADKNWIFGAKVRRLSKYSTLDSKAYFHDRLRDLPKTDAYYFIFPNYYCRAIRHNPFILKRKCIVMYTHQDFSRSYSKVHIKFCLNKAHRVICLNKKAKQMLIEIGVKTPIEVLHIASDPETFQPHDRKTNTIGISCAFSDRKNPYLLFDVIRKYTDKKFIIIGNKWENFEHFEALNNLPHFTYLKDQPYEAYPEFYRSIDIYLSTSKLEGGPVPLLEAMLSNCVPVVTKTGFCEDIIQDGINGYLFDPDDTAEKVIELLKKADVNEYNTRPDVLPFSWENCSKKLDEYFQED